MENVKKSNQFENWINIVFGLLAIITLKSIFDNDSSKIVSNQGKQVLNDEVKMKKIKAELTNAENSKQHLEEIVI